MKRVALVALALLVGCQDARVSSWGAAKRDDLVIAVDIAGTLKAVDSTPVLPPNIPNTWNFKLVRIAPEGSEVVEGEPLVSFDTSTQQRELEQMKNEAESASTLIKKTRNDAAMKRQDEALGLAERKAALTKLELKADQPRDLAALVDLKATAIDRDVAALAVTHAEARAELARRTDAATLAGLRDRLEYANGRLAEIERTVAKMTVTARRAGTVIHPTNWRGDKVKVGDSVWRMRTVVEVVSLEKMLGTGRVDEEDSSKISVGQRVTLRVDSHPDTELVGKVKTIGRSYVAKDNSDPSKVVKVEVELDDTQGLPLRPGMRFRGAIETGRIAETIVVPTSAVFITEDGPVAYRRDGKGYQTVRIEVGARSGDRVEVKSGLAAGDVVALKKPEGA